VAGVSSTSHRDRRHLSPVTFHQAAT